jgi:hypothetical protein
VYRHLRLRSARRLTKREIFPIGSGAQLLSAYVLLKNC